MNKMQVASLTIESLTLVSGGRRDPGEPDDYASKYVGTLEQDGQNWWAREKLLGQAVQNHQWGKAAKHYGAAVLDEVGMLGDALSPLLGGGVKVK